ncbi:Apc13p protein [Metschnikowia aff. pulcherrima]|uniref:Apc13p protein n=1 Tax=Metschnikowia aff. pulcherrima TaxID=2163413 RepID=A0A4V1AE21_9ASCO|nr:Apc13p protein [Metschnikowia aff. pulcherrima]
MSLDSHYSYVHFSHVNQATYMEEWKDYHIPYDEIDTSRLFEETANIFPQFLLEEEEDGAIPLNSSVFGAKVHKDKNLLRKKIWTDLNLDGLRTGQNIKRLPDASILNSLHTTQNPAGDLALNDFLSNGYNAEMTFNPDVLASNMSHDELWLNTTSEYLANHTFSNMRMRSNSGTYAAPHHQAPAPLQTPRVGKTRQPSQEKFQTPITRIVR